MRGAFSISIPSLKSGDPFQRVSRNSRSPSEDKITFSTPYSAHNTKLCIKCISIYLHLPLQHAYYCYCRRFCHRRLPSAGQELAAGQESTGKSGKSGTKSSKSDGCTSCSADTLTRVSILTSLFFNNYGQDGVGFNSNGQVLNGDSLQEYCAGDDETKAEFALAVGNAVSFYTNIQLFIDAIFFYSYFGPSFFDITVTEGVFQSVFGIDEDLCVTETYLQEVGLQCTEFEFPIILPLPPDICNLIDGGGPADFAALALEDGVKYHIESIFKGNS